MWIIPSHGRPELLKRLADSMGKTDLKQPALIILSLADMKLKEYTNIHYPESWRFVTLKENESFCGEKMNAAIRLVPDAKFYGLLCDDDWIDTPDMLETLAEAAGDWYVAYPNADMKDNLVRFPVCGGKLVRAIGWWAHPELKHNCIDSVWWDIGRDLNLLKPFPQFRMAWHSPDIRRTIWDDAYQRAEPINYTAGHMYHTVWCEKPAQQEVYNRIRTAMENDLGQKQS